MAKIKTCWISFDLGLKGDYTSLYAWLDSVGAKECGDNLAYFKKDFEDGDIAEIVKRDLQAHVHISNTDTIYLIYKDDVTHNMKGNFLFGGRKRAVWEGYAVGAGKMEEDIANE